MVFQGMVDGSDVARLRADEFRAVLDRLLTVEANEFQVPLDDLDLSTRNNDPDAGIDGRIQWPIEAAHEHLSPGEVACQYKAGKLSVAKLRAEFRKPGVQQTLKSGGSYLLLVAHDYNPTQAKRLRSELRRLSRRRKLDPDRCRILFGSQIARWISNYPSVVILPELRKNLPLFLTVDRWAHQHDLDWKPDDARAQTIERTRSFFHNRAPGSTLRIEGPAGAGKSRVALEAVRQAGDSASTIYAPNADDENLTELLSSVMANPTMHVQVVADECSFDRQTALRHYVDASDGRIRLLCVGTPDLLSPRLAASANLIFLPPLPEAQIREILASIPEKVPSEIIDIAVRLSQGFVKLAIFICTHLLESRNISLVDLARVGNVGEFLKKFVKPEIRSVLLALSILRRVGWEGPLRIEAESLSSHLRIPFEQVMTVVAALRNQGVLAAQGRYLYVTPDLLAIFAATELWRERGPDLIRVVSDLPGPGPRIQFLMRLAAMGEEPQVRTAVESLLGVEGLYKTLDDLDDEFRSEMFRILSSALPDAATQVLGRIILRASNEELMGFSKGRRNVMWAIESLLRWPNTSISAARALRSLALAESESVGNNATGIFCQYFQMFLSGSPIPLRDRLILVDELDSSASLKSRLLAAQALSSGLKFHEYRMGDNVDHLSGASFPPEWRPPTYHELSESRLALVERVRTIAAGDDEAAQTAREALIGSVFTLVRDGAWENAIGVLEGTQFVGDKEKRDALDAARRIEREVGDRLSSIGKDRLKKLSENLFDSSFRGRLHRWVGRRLHADYDLTGHTGFEKADAEVIALSEEGYRDGISEEDLKWIGSPEADSAWLFGKRLGELDKESRFLKPILNASLRDVNCMLLAGFLVGQGNLKGETFREETLDQLAASEPILAFACTWRGNPASHGVRRVIRLVDRGAIPPVMLGYLSYGGWTNTLSVQEIMSLVTRLLTAPVEQSMDAAMGIMLNLLERESKSISQYEDILWKMLEGTPDRRWNWHWGQIAGRLADRDPQRITRIVLSFFSNEGFLRTSDDPEMQALRNAALARPRECWEVVGAALIENDLKAFRTRLALEEWYGDLIPVEDLISWAKSHQPRGPGLIATLVTVKGTGLPQRARTLLIEFPEDKYVRSAIARNLLSGGSWGPYSKRLEQDIETAKSWAQDEDSRIRHFAQEVVKGLEKTLTQQRVTEEEDLL